MAWFLIAYNLCGTHRAHTNCRLQIPTLRSGICKCIHALASPNIARSCNLRVSEEGYPKAINELSIQWVDAHLGRLVFFVLELLLAVYFVYTLIAIAMGAAPIPSRRTTVDAMMRLADLQPGEVLYDLGSGDGRILFAGSARGARCYGFEINPFLYLYTKLRVFVRGERDVIVTREDFWNRSIAEADVVTAYLVPHAMERLKVKARAELKPGTRIVLAVYPFADWKPEAQEGKAYLYRV